MAMAKGDDAVMKKRNKAIRKRLHKHSESSTAVSARVAAIIASKKRRKSGKRRMCEVLFQLCCGWLLGKCGEKGGNYWGEIRWGASALEAIYHPIFC